MIKAGDIVRIKKSGFKDLIGKTAEVLAERPLGGQAGFVKIQFPQGGKISMHTDNLEVA